VEKIYSVAVNTPFNNSLLTYSSETDFNRGDLVWVPLGRRKEKGCILGIAPQSKENTKFEVKKIDSYYELDTALDSNYLKFLEWCSGYYHYPLGQHIFDILPKLMKKDHALKPVLGSGETFEYSLTNDQSIAINKISNSLGGFSKYLLHGVTGSGKTSVYIKLLEKVAANGKNGLLLIPEINLTPGLLKTFEKHLSCKIFSYHSSVTNSQKYSLWKNLKDLDEPYVIVAVRSGIFLPINNLGVVIVDEEHDGSYKQEDRCCYNARDLAVKLSSQYKCPVVLGSATPSLETYEWAKNHKENYIELDGRPGNKTMPIIKVKDKRESNEPYDETIWPLSKESLDTIKEKVSTGEKVLIFVNRLGFASYMQCRSCGHQFSCQNCSLSLKYFRNRNVLRCSTCEYEEVVPLSCPSCGNLKILQKGFGTEKLEEVISKNIANAKPTRFDRENIKNFKQLQEVLNDFETGKFNVLIGTQMLSKGHNFKDVNYVLVLGVDSQLNFPDFRSAENAFQMITQISGRSGRFGKDGEVVIESYCSENKIFNWIKDYNLKDFYKDELVVRKNLSLPPYSRLCCVYITGKNQSTVINYANNLASLSSSIIEKHFTKVDLIGVRPTFVEKRANKFTWILLLRSESVNDLHNVINSILKNSNTVSGIALKVDVDPKSIN
jgi:primosomal protein N' (replication factor Y)